MTSTRNHSAGSPSDATPRYATPKIAGSDALLAKTDWESYDALMGELAAQSDRAAQLLLAQSKAFTPGVVSDVQSGTGDMTT